MSKSIKLTRATAQEIKNWNKLIQTNPDGGEILQTTAMAEIKKLQGWKPEFWVYETTNGKIYATMLVRRFRGYGKLAYCIRGPGVVDTATLHEIMIANKSVKELFAVMLEPPIPSDEPSLNFMSDRPDLRKTKNIQPNANTIIVDLTPDEKTILSSFKQRARREIRQATKDEIQVKQVRVNDKNMRQMYSLYSETGKRAGFFIRPYGYYHKFWKSFADQGGGELYFAYQPGNNQPVAGAYICKLGRSALYKDGGSRRTSAKHFSHLLQWEIMQNLKKEGVAQYDLHGIPPLDQLENPNHPLSGLNIFKQSFSRDARIFLGTYIQILNPRIYKRWVRHGLRAHQAIAHHIHHTTLF